MQNSSTSPNWLAALRAYLLAVAIADLLWEMAHLPLTRCGGPERRAKRT
jgi:hypothetical protein